jgi:REP element-mobilizing transposase RayT
MTHSPADDLLLVTLKTAKKKPILVGSVARDTIQCLLRVQCFNPFLLYAFVVMPDHVHVLIGGARYGHLIRTIQKWKDAVSHEIGEQIWQQRFDIQLVPASQRMIERLHDNPVRRALVEHAGEYPWSSACNRWDVQPLPTHAESPLLRRMEVFSIINQSALPGRRDSGCHTQKISGRGDRMNDTGRAAIHNQSALPGRGNSGCHTQKNTRNPIAHV